MVLYVFVEFRVLKNVHMILLHYIFTETYFSSSYIHLYSIKHITKCMRLVIIHKASLYSSQLHPYEHVISNSPHIVRDL